MWEQQTTAALGLQLGSSGSTARHRQRRRLDVRRARLPAVGLDLKGQGVTLNYQPVGSGAGVAALAQGTATSPASDPALTPDEVKTLTKGDAVQIPMFFGAITASYNVNGLDKGLKLDGPTLADIFLGKITTWNDPAIASLNPGVEAAQHEDHGRPPLGRVRDDQGLHDVPLRLQPRVEGEVGADKTVKWPTGTGAKGNDGVAAAIKQSDGASATSSRPTRCRTTSTPPTSRTSRASSSPRRWRRPRRRARA